MVSCLKCPSRAPICILIKTRGLKHTSLQQGPYVEEWKAFGPFRDFYEEDLEGGSTFLEDFDMKILGLTTVLESWTHWDDQVNYRIEHIKTKKHEHCIVLLICERYVRVCSCNSMYIIEYWKVWTTASCPSKLSPRDKTSCLLCVLVYCCHECYLFIFVHDVCWGPAFHIITCELSAQLA